jgi:Tfp pilus assembly protein PilN
MRAVNLIPGEERASTGMDAGRAGGGVYAVFAMLGGLAIMALLYGLSAHQISSRKAQVATLNARAQQAQARAAALAPYTSFAAIREQRTQDVAALVNSRFDWAQAFHELGRVLPTNVSLTSLDGQISSTSVSSAGAVSAASSSSSGSPSASGASEAASSAVSSSTPPGSVPSFTLTGCTTSQAAVAVMLDRLRLIHGAEEVTLQSATKSESGGGGGGCEAGGDVTFAATVTFAALPSVPASGPAAKSAFAATGGGASSTGASR